MNTMYLKESILDLSRQNNIGELTPWFNKALETQIGQGLFRTPEELELLARDLTAKLTAYRTETGVSTVVLGMSGGVDSALTAALFKRAGWTVIGVTMPINQNPEETERGVEACSALGIEHRHIDLTLLYRNTLQTMGMNLDPALDDKSAFGQADEATTAVRIRRGNVRARLRMITLYNLASMEGGLVASTDNFSELAAGFWTLHGDVGDVSPIQSLLKSWEVPYISKYVGVPESTYRATPTDGLGISAGDEAQLGGTYLEWDLMINAIIDVIEDSTLGSIDVLVNLRANLGIREDEHAIGVFNSVMKRMGSTWFKRMNPVNLANRLDPQRYDQLANIDNTFFVPKSIFGSSEPTGVVD